MRFRFSLALALCAALAAPAGAQEALRVFPNPVLASGDVTIEAAEVEGAQVEVFSVLGRRVDLDAPLAPGVYAVRVLDALGRVTRTAPLTVAAPASIRVRLRERVATDARGPEKAGPRHMFVHVIGDSHAAGKGDPQATCDLRPGVGPKGWVYRRSFDDFVPACSPEADKLYNGSIFPSLVDELHEQMGITPLVVFYTVKGSRVGPEGDDNDVHWFPGDSETPQSPYYLQAKLVFKRAGLRAVDQFGAAPDTLATLLSVGSSDARLWVESGAPDPVTEFRPRLALLNDSLTASGVPAFYFELTEVLDRPDYNEVLPVFRAEMGGVLPADRIVRHADAVVAAHVASGLPADPAHWFADRAGHLGALGLDLLGERTATLIAFKDRVRRHTRCHAPEACASGGRR